jgi:hypothetical protein
MAASYLWQFSQDLNKLKVYKSTPPVLLPANTKSFNSDSPNFLKSSFATPYNVDVVNSFNWTIQNPKTQSGQLYRSEVPRIELVEKKIKINAIVNQAFYAVATGVSKTGDVSKEVGQFFSDIGSNLGGRAGNTAGSFGSFVTNAVNSLTEGVKKITQKAGVGGDYTGVLAPYDGLYLTENTGWKYNIPYFENLSNEASNAFGELDGSAFSELAQGIGAFIKAGVDFVNIKEPGTYIERTKMFQFPDSGDDITFEFPLINTGTSTFIDVVRNWQLIFLLLYQNRPQRISRDIIEPCVIYEALIPGVKYTPYSYIKRLNVEFMGARRTMKLPIPQLGSLGTTFNTQESFETIVPDAYKVSITLSSLVAETRNFLYSMLYEKKSLVTTNSSSGPFSLMNNIVDATRNALLANGGTNLLQNNPLNPTQILPNFNTSRIPNP